MVGAVGDAWRCVPVIQRLGCAHSSELNIGHPDLKPPALLFLGAKTMGGDHLFWTKGSARIEAFGIGGAVGGGIVFKDYGHEDAAVSAEEKLGGFRALTIGL